MLCNFTAPSTLTSLSIFADSGRSPRVFINPYLMERPDRVDPAVDFVGFRRGVFRPLFER